MSIKFDIEKLYEVLPSTCIPTKVISNDETSDAVKKDMEELKQYFTMGGVSNQLMYIRQSIQAIRGFNRTDILDACLPYLHYNGTPYLQPYDLTKVMKMVKKQYPEEFKCITHSYSSFVNNDLPRYSADLIHHPS